MDIIRKTTPYDQPVTIEPWVAGTETLRVLLALLTDTWSEHPDDPLSATCEMCYASHCLRHATGGFVARAGGDIIGVCLVGATTNGRLSDDPVWADREAHLTAFLRSLPWERERVGGLLSEMAEEDALRRRVLSSALRPDAEILLLVVDARWRGWGVGRMLIGETRRVAERRGWDTLYLLTDTHCDWQAYGHWGFAKIMAEVSPSDFECLRMAYALTPDMMPMPEG